jgi:hypothetical protein
MSWSDSADEIADELKAAGKDPWPGGELAAPTGSARTPWDFAADWYKENEITHAIRRQQKHLIDPADKIPEDIYSPEFAQWLTHQYRLAVQKGIQIGREWPGAASKQII